MEDMDIDEENNIIEKYILQLYTNINGTINLHQDGKYE